MSAPDPTDVTASLLDLLTLRRLDGPSAATFEGDSHPHPGGHVFGGQVMAQALVAMGHTLPSGRRVHSSYGYFLEAADATEPIRFEVDTLRDGGSFSVRRTLARQGERTVLAMTSSFQEEQDGLTHQDRAPEAPSPASLPTTADLLRPIDHPVAQYWANNRPIDIRHVTAPLYYRADSSGDSEQMVWMRSLTEITDVDPIVHDAILAYATDYTPFEPIMRRQGLTWLSPGLRMATLNHAIWWHGRVDMNEWLLYVQRSPSASGGRGLSTGHIYRESGELVATVTQEGMVRLPRPASAE